MSKKRKKFFQPQLTLQPGFSQTQDFMPMDTEARFRKNLKRQPQNWIYRTKPVAYYLNCDGYRTPEWNLVDWSNSVVLFGCSNAFGIGLDQGDILSSQLEGIIGKPVINMAVPGSSIYISYLNLLYLLEQDLKPVAIVNCWTDYSRLTRFTAKGIEDLGNWHTTGLYKEWNLEEANSQQYAHMIRNSARLLTKLASIPHLECSFFGSTANLFDCQWLPSPDRARDLEHPGVESMQRAAEWIASELAL